MSILNDLGLSIVIMQHNPPLKPAEIPVPCPCFCVGSKSESELESELELELEGLVAADCQKKGQNCIFMYPSTSWVKIH